MQPFYLNRLQNGLPYMKDLTDYNSGTIAQSYAPMKGQLARTNAQYGTGLPSGYADQEGIDLNSQEGQAFDNSMVNALNMNEAAKQTAAYGLNPLPYYGGATGANQSVLNAQIQPGGFWNFMGGLANSAVGGLASNPALV